LLDFAFEQFYENAPKFGFSTTSDNIYRYVQGVFLNFQDAASTLDMQVRFSTSLRNILFPEGGKLIRDLVLVSNTEPGTILEKYGMPMVIRVKPELNPDDHEKDQKIRLPFTIETEFSEFLVMRFREKQNRLDPIIRSGSVVNIDDQARNLFHDVFDTVKGDKFRDLLSRRLLHLYDRYGRGKEIVMSHMLGKLLLPGPGAKCYLLETTQQTTQQASVWLMLIRNSHALMIGFSELNLGDGKGMLSVLSDLVSETLIRRLHLFEIKNREQPSTGFVY